MMPFSLSPFRGDVRRCSLRLPRRGRNREETRIEEEVDGTGCTCLSGRFGEEGSMPRATCPACGKGFRLEEAEAVLHGKVYCPNCDAPLEVIGENPLMLEELDD